MGTPLPGAPQEAPRVSVSMPNYNDAEYLREAVDAILGQSYRSLELIIVDDASKDDSWSIISEIAARDSRVRAFRNEKNRGCVPTVNRGLSEARGQFLYMASSNDKMLPGFLEKSVALLDAHPQAGVCYSDPTHFFDSNGTIISRPLGLSDRPTYLSVDDLIRFYDSGRATAPLYGTPALMTRAAFDKAGGYIAELRWNADFFLVAAIAFRTGMCYIPEPLTSQRILPQSFWRTGITQSKAGTEIVRAILDLLLSENYREVKDNFIRSSALSYLGMPLVHLANQQARYRPFLPRNQLLKAVLFSAKRRLRCSMSVPLQQLYFRVRESLRSRALGLPHP